MMVKLLVAVACQTFWSSTFLTHYLILIPFFSFFPLITLAPADDGDYWRLLNAGTHILTATAKGYSRVSKRVYLPHNMKKAGRVDFVLSKVALFAFRSC